MRLSTFIRIKTYEHIERKVRRHCITLVPATFIFVLLLALPFGSRWLVITIFPSVLDSLVLSTAAVLFGSVYYLSVLLFFYSYFINFYLNVLVTTNDRLIDVEQRTLLSHHVSETDLHKVTEVTSDVSGAFATLFNYGTLTVLLDGDAERMVIEAVPHPDKLRREILDLAEIDKNYHRKN